MRCTYCGFEDEKMLRFCPNCGRELSASHSPEPPPENPWAPPPGMPPRDTASAPILAVLQNTLFLLICILVSVNCLMSFSSGSVPLLNILLTVFLWLAYSVARKGHADPEQLRCVSGTVFASYVISYVVAGLIALCGLIFAAAFSMIGESSALMDEVFAELELDAATQAIVADVFGTLTGPIIMAIFLVIAALIVVINLFSTRYIHRFAKSVYQSLQKGRLELKAVRPAKIWLFIFGGFSLLSAVSAIGNSEVISCIASASIGTAQIMAGVLIGQLEDPAPTPTPDPTAGPEF